MTKVALVLTDTSGDVFSVLVVDERIAKRSARRIETANSDTSVEIVSIGDLEDTIAFLKENDDDAN